MHVPHSVISGHHGLFNFPSLSLVDGKVSAVPNTLMLSAAILRELAEHS